MEKDDNVCYIKSNAILKYVSTLDPTSALHVANKQYVDQHANTTTIHVTTTDKDKWNAKANSVHVHTTSDITDLSNALSTKADTSHIHTLANVTGLNDALLNKSNTGHTHTIDNITGLSTALSNKSDSNHNHDTSYLSLSGGTVNGNITVGGIIAIGNSPTADNHAATKQYVDTHGTWGTKTDFPDYYRAQPGIEKRCPNIAPITSEDFNKTYDQGLATMPFNGYLSFTCITEDGHDLSTNWFRIVYLYIIRDDIPEVAEQTTGFSADHMVPIIAGMISIKSNEARAAFCSAFVPMKKGTRWFIKGHPKKDTMSDNSYISSGNFYYQYIPATSVSADEITEYQKK